MKIYIHENGIVLAGKAWEVRAKLKESMIRYKYVEDWVNTIHSPAMLKLVSKEATTDQKKAGSS
jgi:hypothetical protein